MSAYSIHIIQKTKLNIRIESEELETTEMPFAGQLARGHQSSTAIEIESIRLPSKKTIRNQHNVSIVNGKLAAKIEAYRLRERL
ncbi:MAG TPA: hypothetical protein DCS80_02035 [Betaproteobacteria bacterium]|nr:hypothetical protein [Betaproteobacteria bacterium]